MTSNHSTRNLLSLLLLAAALVACGSSSSGSAGDSSNGTSNGACVAGELGCACTGDSTCDGELACVNGLCVPDDGGDAGSDTTVDMDTSDMDTGPEADAEPDAEPDVAPDTTDPMPRDGLGLAISSDAARACEVVLSDVEEAIAEVTFDAGVTGRFMRRGERVAIAVIADADEPIAEGAVGFTLSPDAEGAEGVTFLIAQCFDLQRQALNGAEVTIVDNR